MHNKLDISISMQLLNGNITNVTLTSTVHLSPQITLRNVPYVPQFQFNLISVSKVYKENSCWVFFDFDTCFFQALSTGKLMGLGNLSEVLFFWTAFPNNFDFSPIVSNKISLCNATTNDKNFLLHSRMGHSTFFPCSKCYMCPMAKQSSTPFRTNKSHSSDIFSLIHVDVWGPHCTAHRDGSRYFLTILDDYSHATWIFLMQSKGQVPSNLKSFIILTKNQFEKSIRRIRIDNGK